MYSGRRPRLLQLALRIGRAGRHALGGRQAGVGARRLAAGLRLIQRRLPAAPSPPFLVVV